MTRDAEFGRLLNDFVEDTRERAGWLRCTLAHERPPGRSPMLELTDDLCRVARYVFLPEEQARILSMDPEGRHATLTRVYRALLVRLDPINLASAQ